MTVKVLLIFGKYRCLVEHVFTWLQVGYFCLLALFFVMLYTPSLKAKCREYCLHLLAVSDTVPEGISIFKKEASASLVSLPDNEATIQEKDGHEVFDPGPEFWESLANGDTESMGFVGKQHTPYKEALPRYIARFAKVAQAEQQKFGIPASITLAQGILESKAGLSTLSGDKVNNHFGMKCFKKGCRHKWCPFRNDEKYLGKQPFQRFDNAWASYRAHSLLITNGRYAEIRKRFGKTDYKSWARALKACGYATARHYDKQLIALIEKLNLHEYDK